MFSNYIYQIIKNIKPFRTAIFAVAISIIATYCVAIISYVGKDLISREMDSMGLNGMTVVMYDL